MPSWASDPAAFADASFTSHKVWVNTTLRENGPMDVDFDEPLDLCISVLLTKLQLSAADVDANVHCWCAELAGLSTSTSRELGAVYGQSQAVRVELSAMLDEVSALKAKSAASVVSLRDTLALHERLCSVAHTLHQAERVAGLVHVVESAFTCGDGATCAGGVAQLSNVLAVLDEDASALFPEAPANVAALRAQVLDKLMPDLLRALREHDAPAMHRLNALYGDLGAATSVREAYVECAQGPIFEAWNSARRRTTIAEALRSLWACLGKLVPIERAFCVEVFVTDAALLPTLVGEALEITRVAASSRALLVHTQQLALTALTAPIASAIRLMGSAELASLWSGATDEDEQLASALLVYSASPQAYIMRVGDGLLGLPQQLEPFASGPTLSQLSAEAGGFATVAGGEELGALSWLHALGHKTVDLMLEAVGRLPALSCKGAKQLAADAGYIDNILSGLAVPPDPRLAELCALLTAPPAELPVAVAAASALPIALAAALAAKRGVQC